MLTDDKVIEIFVMRMNSAGFLTQCSAVVALTSPKMEGSVITTAIAGCRRPKLL